jgi:hypothetical protein
MGLRIKLEDENLLSMVESSPSRRILATRRELAQIALDTLVGQERIEIRRRGHAAAFDEQEALADLAQDVEVVARRRVQAGPSL